MSSEILMEVRGCMTRFEPLTSDLVRTLSCDGLTYEELAVQMQNAGLSIDKVVCDPTRKLQNAYYADFENGRYCEVYLQRSWLDSLLQIATMHFSSGNMSELLERKDWRNYYLRDVPVPMLIYDFQRRYLDIDVDMVFDVWVSIHTRIDYAKDLWRSEVLDYVFSHAPTPELPPIESDGRITIYRGMGSLSQHPDKAISWTTDPVNALWFANRSGRGTALLIARVLPEQVVAYLPSFRNENEIIVRPGTITDYQVADMIPSEESSVSRMLVPTFAEFYVYSRIAKTLGYPVETPFQHHGIRHIFRVLLLSLIYFYNSGDSLTNADKEILIYFSLLHDIGRCCECVDESHGEKALQHIKKNGIRLKGIKLSPKEFRMANLLIAYHCRDDEIGISAFQKEPNFSFKDKQRTEKLYAIAKDMDGLDRVRFNGLDYRMLRTQYGRRLPLVAGGLLEEALLKRLATEEWEDCMAALMNHDEVERHE